MLIALSGRMWYSPSPSSKAGMHFIPSCSTAYHLKLGLHSYVFEVQLSGCIIGVSLYAINAVTDKELSAASRCGRRVLQMHVYCLQLLKDALGERQTRMLEVALAAEASMVVMNGVGHSPGRPPRSQFHLSPETPESNSALANDVGGSPGLGRAPTAAAAVAALVASLVVNGITSLERMVSVLRIKDGLENLQLLKSGGPTSNGMSRVGSMGSNVKADTLAEANIYWFRVLIGDCRTVAGGLVADLLGESTVLGLAHMQRAMPLTAVFPPAYAIFAAALHRNQAAYNNTNKCEDLVAQAVTVAVNDMVAFEPFRDVCLRDTRALYLLLLDDTGESDYAAMLDIQGLELNKKILAIVPLRARLFLYALLDRKMSDDDIWGQGQTHTSTEPGQVEQLVRVCAISAFILGAVCSICKLGIYAMVDILMTSSLNKNYSLFRNCHRNAQWNFA